MDALLQGLIALIVAGVVLAVARFVISRFFPDFAPYFNIIVMIVAAALFIFLLRLVWPFLTGAGPSPSPSPYRY